MPRPTTDADRDAVRRRALDVLDGGDRVAPATHWIDVESGTEIRIPIENELYPHHEIQDALRADGYRMDGPEHTRPRYRIDYANGESSLWRVGEVILTPRHIAAREWRKEQDRRRLAAHKARGY